MGFKRERKHYRLKFEDPALDGLEVTATSIKLRDFLTISLAAAKVADSPADAADEATLMYRQLAGALVSWNLLDDDDKPVPATYEGLQDQELDLVLEIVHAWMEAIATVDPTLRGTSSSGATFPEGSLRMEAL